MKPDVFELADMGTFSQELSVAFLSTACVLNDIFGIVNLAKSNLSGKVERSYKLVGKKTKRRRIDFRLRLLNEQYKLFKTKK